MSKVKAAILGSGNIGTDLMYKILKNDGAMEIALVAGIDPESEGLQRAKEAGIAASHEGIKGILADPDIKIVFDATSAKAHVQAAEQLREAGKMAIDLTPAAVGPYLVPPVNLMDHIEAKNVNMVSCAGQATTPLVYAVSRVVPVHYAEMIATVASRAIGPGTRQNVDEFTRTTANSLIQVGGATKARAIPVFNPAEPPIIMTNTVYAAITEKDFDFDAVKKSIADMIQDVSEYVPGYRLKGEPIVDYRDTPWGRLPVVVIMNEVEGAGDFFPTYAGNLDIMTASARRVGELYANHFLQKEEVQQ
ncbi:acetaldehyde dehydrogenase (acetylating) [Oceanobacillus piezotolerans]|uniref:Acetaldehyde dehydrogenase n=1 Tax=Oceanobacillus piezotolerans TaxID=2448030 RepID=A0A498D6V5_9BACI|nr:acetaldehyde dehydrogenase (acetylating) [Oceanobacillus piezotolerans]RLL43744.1 acetaldehyde dehydrogenase (acetylating) [Oceanobacillus piezotolerans]